MERRGRDVVRPFGPLFATFFEDRFFYAPRMPADPFARSAVSSQRSLLAAQFSRSAVSIIPSKPGRAPGVGQGAQIRGPRAPGGPRGPGGGARCVRARADARFARGGPLIRNKSYAEWNR